MCKIEGKMTQALQDGVTKTNEQYCFNHSRVIFLHDNDPKHTSNLVKQRLSVQILMYLLGLLNHLP